MTRTEVQFVKSVHEIGPCFDRQDGTEFGTGNSAMSATFINDQNAVSSVSHNHFQSISSATSSAGQELRLSMPSHRRFITPVVTMLQEFCERYGAFEKQELVKIGVALEEALVNSVVHGNLQINSSLRDQDDGSFEKMIALRQEKAPYRQRRVEIISRYWVGAVSFTISDEGSGFDPAAVPDPLEGEFAARLHGRGMLIMRSFMDTVAYNSIGNQVTLTKRCATV